MYKHILVASALCGNLVVEKKAKEVADKLRAKLSIVHTIEPIPAYGYPDLEDLKAPFIEEAKKMCQTLGAELGVGVEDQHVLYGSVKHEVLELANQLEVDLIVIGSHGRHGFSRLLGSGANGIINSASCDVLTVRYPDE